MKKEKEKVVFYFPWKELSGGPFYLTNLANELAKNDNFEVYYVDYKNGLTDSMLNNPSVKKIEYTDSNFKFPIKEPITIITPIYWAHRIPQINEKSKIVFFNWHYCCIPVLAGDSRWPAYMLNKLLQLVNKHSACFFCDYTHLLGQNTEDIHFKENFVPVTLQQKNIKAKEDLVNPNEINIGILGRIDGDKVYSIVNLLDNIVNLNLSKRVNLHVIGDGVHRELFENICKESDYKSKNINVIQCGTMIKDELNEYMANRIDVLFAMGTSVLEGAAISLPSVIVPSFSSKFDDNKYVYLHKSFKNCLGWFVTQMDDLDVEPIKLSQIIDDIYNKNLKRELGKKDYEYYLENHMKNIDKFVYAINDSTLKYSDIKRIYKRLNLYKIFSISNFQSKKIIYICGIKITTKNNKVGGLAATCNKK